MRDDIGTRAQKGLMLLDGGGSDRPEGLRLLRARQTGGGKVID